MVVSEGVNNQHQVLFQLGFLETDLIGIQMHSDMYMYNVVLLDSLNLHVTFVIFLSLFHWKSVSNFGGGFIKKVSN